MIPKTIHYIWLGKAKLPRIVKKCLKTWKKNCPSYEIKLWNEDNLNLEMCDFVKEAYACKKYAFASDVLRLQILKEYGGIYLDVDVKVFKNFDKFLNEKAFCGFETSNSINWGIVLGAEKDNPIIDEVLEIYKKRKFINIDGSYNDITICDIVTDILKKYGLKTDNTYQKLDNITCYPSEFFAPKDMVTGRIKKTKNSVSMHLYAGSWTGKKRRFLRKIKDILNFVSFGMFGKILRRKNKHE